MKTRFLKNSIERERIELNNYENLDHIKLGLKMAAEYGSVGEMFSNSFKSHKQEQLK